MSFRDDNKAYESWLHRQCDVVKSDLDYKHRRMKESAFTFLRATYFRWARKIGDWCPELMDAPRVLAVGDLHLENFGTWRDADGRLVWGVNDFDEAAVMPYVLDLVRLATSMRLAPRPAVSARETAEALLEGYREGLDDPQAALLFEGQTWLRPYAEPGEGEPEEFWSEVKAYPTAKPRPQVAAALRASLPREVARNPVRFARIPRKGCGSLGRPRYAAITYWRSGQIVREAKALVPSAWSWAHGEGARAPSNFKTLAKGPYRAPDPFLDVRNGYILRRIAPDSRKIELGELRKHKLQRRLIKAMGFDLAAIHAAAAPRIARLKDDLKRRRKQRNWLDQAAEIAEDKVRRDFREWRG